MDIIQQLEALGEFILAEKVRKVAAKNPNVSVASCKCQSCGRQYTVDLVIPNELWEQIKPSGKPVGAGMLCAVCIMSRIEEISGYDYWYLRAPTDKQNRPVTISPF